MNKFEGKQTLTLCVERNARRRELHLGKGNPERLKREIDEYQAEIDRREKADAKNAH